VLTLGKTSELDSECWMQLRSKERSFQESSTLPSILKVSLRMRISTKTLKEESSRS
jgi:hypothetical protein